MKDPTFTPYIDAHGHHYNECFLVSWNPKVPRWCAEPVPSWAYIRKVSHVTKNGSRYLECSCGHCNMFGSACRHMYSLLNRKPVVSDSSPRCMKLYSLQYWKNPNLTQAVDSYLENNPFGRTVLKMDDELASPQSWGTMQEEGSLFQEWFQKTISSVVAWPESPFYDTNSKPLGGTDESLDDNVDDNEDHFILQEQSCFEDCPTDIPEMPVFVVEGAPVLMATPPPQMPSKHPPLSAMAIPPSRGRTETQLQVKKRKRDEAISSFMKLVQKAKTVNEYQHIIDKCNHTQLELDSKHASTDAYNCITDNLDGTISACVPITQSCNQGRMKKVNEVPSSTKKKLQF
jgi:hypothetical protein